MPGVVGKAFQGCIAAETQAGVRQSTTETALGWPVGCVDAGDTTVYVRQAPAGAGLVIEICTKTDAEQDALAVTLDGRRLHPGGPSPVQPA